MCDYEMMIATNLVIDKRNITNFVDKLPQTVPNEGNVLGKVDIRGKRRLAYDINKRSEDIYMTVNMKTTPETAQELDRQLGLNKAILRTRLLRTEV